MDNSNDGTTNQNNVNIQDGNYVGRDNIDNSVHIGTLINPQKSNPCIDANDDIESYLKTIEDEEFKPLKPLFNKILSKKMKLPAIDLYIPPDVVGEEHSSPISVLSKISDNRHVVLLSNPGEGKSTLLNRLAYCLAQKVLKTDHEENTKEKCRKVFSEFQHNDEGIMPIVIRIQEFMVFIRTKSTESKSEKEKPKPNTKALLDYLREIFDGRQLKVMDCIEIELRAGRVFLLLDGLDEVWAEERNFVRDVIWEFCKSFPKNRILVTCRYKNYVDFPTNTKLVLPSKGEVHPDGFVELQIRPFDDAQIREFIKRWYKFLEMSEEINKSIVPSSQRKLAAAIEHRGLSDLAKNPLLLNLMALVHHEDRELPESRVFLYDRIIKLYLWDWDKQETLNLRLFLRNQNIEELHLEQALSIMAFNARKDYVHNNSKEVLNFEFSELKKCWQKLEHEKNRRIVDKASSLKVLRLMDNAVDNAVNNAVDMLRYRSPLLISTDSDSSDLTFTFPHLTFQEYLTSAYLSSVYFDIVEEKDKPKESFSELAIKLFVESHIHWHEVILTAVGRQIHILYELEKPLILAARLCPQELPSLDIDPCVWQKVWLAGDIIREIGVEKIKNDEVGIVVLERVRKSLVKLLISDTKFTIEQRKRIGDTLSDLGDARFDSSWGLTEEALLGFVLIPNSGKVAIGYPSKKISVADFWISKFPVTVGQYNQFVKDYNQTIYQDFQSREKNESKDLDNHPVRHVTQQDAVDYCNWLNEKLNELAVKKMQPESASLLNEEEKKFWKGLKTKKYKVMLPSNEEWEKAASGADGRTYPWGNEFFSDKANLAVSEVKESIRPSVTVASVGIFPPTAYGLYDMCGNVWEWTRSEENGIYYIRGACYSTESVEQAMCIYKTTEVGGVNNFKYIGFRVVISPVD